MTYSMQPPCGYTVLVTATGYAWRRLDGAAGAGYRTWRAACVAAWHHSMTGRAA